MGISQTNEAALEAYIERSLTGGVSGDEMASSVAAEPGAGYVRGKPGDYSAEFALDETMFWTFLEKTQGKELEKLHHKADWRRQVVERLHRKLKKDGILAALKKGLDVDNAHLTLLYRQPYNTLNPEVDAK